MGIQHFSKKEVLSMVINQFLSEKKELKFLEIGVAGGATSKYLLDTHLNATLYAFDPFEAYFDKPTRDHDKTLKIYEKRMKNHIDSGRLKFERKSSFKYLVERNNSQKLEFFDFAYIDGDHSAKAVLEDFILSLPLVKQGG